MQSNLIDFDIDVEDVQVSRQTRNMFLTKVMERKLSRENFLEYIDRYYLMYSEL